MDDDIHCRKLDDAQLLASLKECVADERKLLAKMLRRLAEVDRRKLYAKKQYPSLFAFCVSELGFTHGAAARRIHAARAAADFPIIYRRVSSGRISLSAVSLLAPHLTESNYKSLLNECEGKSWLEIDRIVADLAPRPAPRDRVRHLGRGKKEHSQPQQNPPGSVDLPLGAGLPAQREGEGGVKPPGDTDDPAPAAGDPAELEWVEIRFTADEALYERLKKARQLLRHKFPAGRFEDIFMDALESLLEKIDPERRHARRVRRARRLGGSNTQADDQQADFRPESAGGRRIPQRVRDEVWRRDAGRCAFVGKDGKRCYATEFLHIDHLTPWALGGPSDNPQNLRILCAEHNAMEARRIFGDEHMSRFERGRKPGTRDVPAG